MTTPMKESATAWPASAPAPSDRIERDRIERDRIEQDRAERDRVEHERVEANHVDGDSSEDVIERADLAMYVDKAAA